MKLSTDSKEGQRVVALLCATFSENKSVRGLVGEGRGMQKRLIGLMEYALAACLEFGEVWLSDELDACALVLFKDRKSVSLKSLLRDVQFVFNVVGLRNIKKVIRKQQLIDRAQAETLNGSLAAYLWFIGVDTEVQGLGKGTALLKKLLAQYSQNNRIIILETSTQANLPFYECLGFSIYHKVDVGYPLYFLKAR